jgi:hypothetical protein
MKRPRNDKADGQPWGDQRVRTFFEVPRYAKSGMMRSRLTASNNSP